MIGFCDRWGGSSQPSRGYGLSNDGREATVLLAPPTSRSLPPHSLCTASVTWGAAGSGWVCSCLQVTSGLETVGKSLVLSGLLSSPLYNGTGDPCRSGRLLAMQVLGEWGPFGDSAHATQPWRLPHSHNRGEESSMGHPGWPKVTQSDLRSPCRPVLGNLTPSREFPSLAHWRHFQFSPFGFPCWKPSLGGGGGHRT